LEKKFSICERLRGSTWYFYVLCEARGELLVYYFALTLNYTVETEDIL